MPTHYWWFVSRITQWLTGLSHLTSPSTISEAVNALEAIRAPLKTSSNQIMVTLATALYHQGKFLEAVNLLVKVRKPNTSSLCNTRLTQSFDCNLGACRRPAGFEWDGFTSLHLLDGRSFWSCDFYEVS